MSVLRHLDYPPVWLVGHMLLAQFMANVWAPLGDWAAVPGWILILGGLALMGWAGLAFQKAATTIVPHREPSALVETGPYRWSRNPIYLADLVILAGWALLLGAPAALVLLGPLYVVLTTRFVLKEEAILADRLGEAYTAYRARVPRWI